MSFLFLSLLNNVCDFYYPSTDCDRGFFKCPLLKNKSEAFPGCIIYAATIFYYTFDIFTEIDVPFILITGKTDHQIPYFEYDSPALCGYKILENKKLIKWYGNNVDLKHPKLSPLPLGLPKNIPWIENNYMTWATCSSTAFTNFLNNRIKNKEAFKSNKNKLLYIKMTIENSNDKFTLTRYKNIRKIFLDKLKDEFEFDTSLIPWDQYIKELTDYKFCLSLPGRGLDCYRTWECLYLGVIPIVLNTPIHSLYKNLPIVVVNDASEITKEFLNKEYIKIINNLESFEWEKLNLEYWTNKIKMFN